MPRPWCRRLAGFILALAVAVPALPQEGAVRPWEARETPGVFSQIVGLLVSLFEETGSTLDPFGTPQPTVTSTTQSSPAAGDSGDTGSTLDPFGGH